jgi:hypothetical protein
MCCHGVVAANKLCVSNTQIKLKGINYFGFENGQTSFDGLWAGPTALSLGTQTADYRAYLVCYHDAFMIMPLALRIIKQPDSCISTACSDWCTPTLMMWVPYSMKWKSEPAGQSGSV